MPDVGIWKAIQSLQFDGLLSLYPLIKSPCYYQFTHSNYDTSAAFNLLVTLSSIVKSTQFDKFWTKISFSLIMPLYCYYRFTPLNYSDYQFIHEHHTLSCFRKARKSIKRSPRLLVDCDCSFLFLLKTPAIDYLGCFLNEVITYEKSYMLSTTIFIKSTTSTT